MKELHTVNLEAAIAAYVADGGHAVKTVIFNGGTHMRTKGNLELLVTADLASTKAAIIAVRDTVANNKIQYMIWLGTAKHARINEGDVFTFSNGLTVRYDAARSHYCEVGHKGNYTSFYSEFEFLYWLKRFF